MAIMILPIQQYPMVSTQQLSDLVRWPFCCGSVIFFSKTCCVEFQVIRLWIHFWNVSMKTWRSQWMDICHGKRHFTHPGVWFKRVVLIPSFGGCLHQPQKSTWNQKWAPLAFPKLTVTFYFLHSIGLQVLNSAVTEEALSLTLDQAAISIQRGRDHGLPSFTLWRKWCKLDEVRHDFYRITSTIEINYYFLWGYLNLR